MKNTQEDHPATEMWWKRKRHEDYPASVACLFNTKTTVGVKINFTFCSMKMIVLFYKHVCILTINRTIYITMYTLTSYK